MSILINQNVMMAQALQFFAAEFETDRLRTEIFDNFKKHDGITCKGVSEMKFLDMCIAVLPFLDRTCLRDYKVENSDLVIEKGLDVYIQLFALNYNPEFFTQPEKYDPQKFANKSKINNEGLYYVPFGDGPRIFIGK
ncbi:hypothetical protein D910_03248 [Dendroctonus ponderosae]|uniref:Cytochrome P450 n=1 Tax=Dendroctonus ponderosae TaxID=77166 RepID=U4U0P0_DENPD|nr:hypothetical protein D910_03248 [Dendroctonus ponderosae]